LAAELNECNGPLSDRPPHPTLGYIQKSSGLGEGQGRLGPAPTVSGETLIGGRAPIAAAERCDVDGALTVGGHALTPDPEDRGPTQHRGRGLLRPSAWVSQREESIH
jgi:hypothetical protein